MSNDNQQESVARIVRNFETARVARETAAEFLPGDAKTHYLVESARAERAVLAGVPELAALATLYASRIGVLTEALRTADGAINEMFRYFDGGETRGSYDGKPERDQLRKAGYAVRAVLAKEQSQ